VRIADGADATGETLPKDRNAEYHTDMNEWSIQPVPSDRREMALRFLAGGGQSTDAVEQRAAAFALACQEDGVQTRLWWALRSGLCQAACAALQRPGRTVLLLTPAPDAPGVVPAAQALLMRRLAQDCLADGTSLVQLFLRPHDHLGRELAQAAGLELLAELLYLRLDRPDRAPEQMELPRLTWRTCGQVSPRELGELIEATYVHSLDCPLLSGRRRIEDVLESHRHSGTYRPGSWWIADLDGRPAGCLLLNTSPVGLNCGDIVYVGVAEPFRGRGLGRVLVRRAVGELYHDRLTALTLAVDARNVYARRIYRDEGFYRIDRRLAFAALGPQLT